MNPIWPAAPTLMCTHRAHGCGDTLSRSNRRRAIGNPGDPRVGAESAPIGTPPENANAIRPSHRWQSPFAHRIGRQLPWLHFQLQGFPFRDRTSCIPLP